MGLVDTRCREFGAAAVLQHVGHLGQELCLNYSFSEQFWAWNNVQG